MFFIRLLNCTKNEISEDSANSHHNILKFIVNSKKDTITTLREKTPLVKKSLLRRHSFKRKFSAKISSTLL